MSEHPDSIERTIARLTAACRERGLFLTGDDRVAEADAGELLGLQPRTLARKRAAGTGPQWHRIGGAGYRVSYRLSSLAVWLDQHAGTNCGHEPAINDHEPPSTAAPAVEPEALPGDDPAPTQQPRQTAPEPCKTID